MLDYFYHANTLLVKTAPPGAGIACPASFSKESASRKKGYLPVPVAKSSRKFRVYPVSPLFTEGIFKKHSNKCSVWNPQLILSEGFPWDQAANP
jgi:hypothetical protein